MLPFLQFCDIGDSLDIEALSKVASGEYKVTLCRTVSGCDDESIESIRKEIESEQLDRVVFAGCSPRVRIGVDSLENGVLLERVNLREQVVWCQPPNEEDTQMMAEDYLRMGIVKLTKRAPLEPFQESESINKTIMVVGGGIAGLTAAIEAAKAGSRQPGRSFQPTAHQPGGRQHHDTGGQGPTPASPAGNQHQQHARQQQREHGHQGTGHRGAPA